ITVRLTEARAGQDALAVTPKAVKIAKIKPSVAVKRLASGKVRVTVKAKGIAKPTGKITVKYGSKASVTYKLTAKAKGKISKTPPKKVKQGAYKVKATYTGSTQIAKKTSRTVKIKVG
ncbi:MAG: hypothetical protein LBT54_02045, partial [Bifidobacteriaceae bacterium]|nr:hypothetical protein [Bifidobacteriaceae bacterium]